MMILSKIISTTLDNFGRRIVKVLGIGKNAFTATQANNFGVDSNPFKGMTAVYGETGRNGKTVIIGYFNRDLLAEVGETRIFSTDEAGLLKTYIWLKNDGKINIGGVGDNLLKFTPLNAALQQQVSAINVELNKISAAITIAGGSYLVAPISLDISSSKIDQLNVAL